MDGNGLVVGLRSSEAISVPARLTGWTPSCPRERTPCPAERRIRVNGSNSDGIWNERGTAVAVTVTPPVWATWWFRGLVGLLLVGLAVGGYRLQVRRIETRNRLLERQVAERTSELAAVNSIAAVASRSPYGCHCAELMRAW